MHDSVVHAADADTVQFTGSNTSQGKYRTCNHIHHSAHILQDTSVQARRQNQNSLHWLWPRAWIYLVAFIVSIYQCILVLSA